MKLNFRLLTVCLLLCASLFGINEAKASHASGADLTYTCLGNNQYQFQLSLFRDCEGIAAPTGATINFTSSCGSSTSLSLTRQGNGVEVSQLCPSQLGSSSCNGGNLPGMQQYTYTGTITLPYTCADWNISYALNARNAAITNLNNADIYDLYVEATLNNTNGLCNNSPFFTSLPVPYVCSQDLFFYNHGAVDVDGDSLVYTMVQPRDTRTAVVPYNSGFSVSNPMATVNGFNFNTQTGQMSATPSTTQNAVVAVRVDEYRNGVLIGSTIRDMQFVVINCSSNNLPQASGVNGTTDFFIEVCAGSANCFDIFTTDADANQTVTISWNNGIPGGTFTSSGGSRPTGTFCWTPSFSDIRPSAYDFTVLVQDDACPSVGSQVFSYSVFVRGLDVDLGADQTLCASSYEITPNTSGGSGVYSYIWNTGDTTETLTVTTSGTYSVTVSDTAGCTGSDNIVVTLNQFGNLDLISYDDTTICPNTSVVLEASAGFATYLWSNGSTSNTTVADTAGIYIVTVTDSVGCTNIDTVEVLINNNLTVDLGPDQEICENTSLTLDAGAGFASYDWNTGETTQTISVDAAGEYFVVVSDSRGCTATDTIEVTVNPAPFLTLGPDRFSCTPVLLSIRRPVGFSYLWNTGATTSSITATTTGSYILTITDQFGCSASDTVEIEISAVADLIPFDDTTICAGDTLRLEVFGTTQQLWSTGSVDTYIDVTSTGMYTVRARDINGCLGIDTVFVSVSPLPVVNLGRDLGVCDANGTIASIDAGAGFDSYLWSTGDTTQEITNVGIGTYTVTVANAVGCTDTDTIEVFLFPAPVVDLGVDDTLCIGSTIILDAGSGFASYEWSDGSTASTLAITAAGTYSVTVVDQNGCTTADTITYADKLCCFPATFGNQFTLIDATNNTISSSQVWEGKYYVTADVTVSGSATLDLTNVDVVFLNNTGITFTDFAQVRANNSVFRTCDENTYWDGFAFEDNASGTINESTFKNAEYALNITTALDVKVSNNEFYNSYVGIMLDNAGNGEYAGNITGNTFVTNADIPNYMMPNGNSRTDFYGIRLFNTNFTALLSQNDFVNSSLDLSADQFFGVYINASGVTASSNTFTNMERAFDVAGNNNAVTIEGNTIEYTTYNEPNFLAIRVTGEAAFVLIDGNTITNSALTGAPTRLWTQSGIWIDNAKNVLVTNNEISGVSRGIRAGSNSQFVDLYNNTLTNITDHAIILRDGSDYSAVSNKLENFGSYGFNLIDVASNLTIEGNEIDGELGTSVRGINYLVTAGTSVDETTVSISSNCVRNVRTALAFTSDDNGNLLPTIQNNYLYNYSNTGVYNNRFEGQIGSCANYPTNAGKNSFVSNYLAPYGTALDVRSDNATILVMGNSANLVTNFPNVLVNTSCNTTSTASCGNQIGNNEDGGRSAGPLAMIMMFQNNIQASYPLNINGNDYLASADLTNMINEVPATERAQFVINMMKVLAANTTNAELNSLFTTVNNSGLLSANDRNWVAYHYNKMVGNYNLALNSLNAYTANTVDAQDMVTIEGIVINMLLNDRNVQDLNSNEIATLKAIDDANRFNSNIARDLVQASIGQHDYKLGEEPLPIEQLEGTTTAISLEEDILEIFPNPASNTLTIRYNATTELSETSLTIVDVLGREVYRSGIEFENGEITVNVEPFASGAYIVALTHNKEVVKYSKLIKK